MKIVVLAEGMEEQLWPLSSSDHPKSLLPLLNAPEGAAESLLQRLWRQLQGSGLHSEAFIVVSNKHADLLLEQLGAAAPLIRLPEQDRSITAIALAASYLYSVAGVPLTEMLLVIQADLYADDLSLSRLVDIVSDKASCESKRLTELGDSGGITVVGMDAMISMLTVHSLPLPYEQLYKQFGLLSKLPLQEEGTALRRELPAALGISRIDSWSRLAEIAGQSQSGKGRMTKESSHSCLFNELDIPIAVVGLSDVIVAASPNGIVVMNRDDPVPLAQLTDFIQAPPMYVQQSWGSIQILECAVDEGQQVLVRRVTVKAGHNLCCELHLSHKEVWTMVSGEGELLLDGELRIIKPGDVIEIGARKWHSLRANRELVLLEVQSGASLGDEDRIVLAEEWEDIRSLMNQGGPFS